MIARACTIICFCLAVMAAIPAADAGGTTDTRTDVERILGVVENGRFVALHPADRKSAGLRLTTIKRQEARAVESGELDLSDHEGDAIMIEGIRDSGWLYEARIVDRGGPILTSVVRQIFSRHSR